MLYIDAQTVRKAASIPEWVAVMKNALSEAPHYDRCMQKRQHIDFGRNTFLLMPCVNENYWVTKLVSFCPGNPELGKPSIYGTLILNDSRTGEPLAVMDGGMITAMRTAAVGSAGLDLLAPPGVRTLGVVGAGTQGMYQAMFACQVRDFDRICFYDKSDDAAGAFTAFIRKELPGMSVEQVKDTTELAKSAEVIITATNADQPVFPSVEGMLKGKTILAVGSYKPDHRELPPTVFDHVSRVFVDTMHAMTESGDLTAPLGEGLIQQESIHPLGRLIHGELTVGTDPTRLFKTVGSAVYDLFAAELVYRKTRSQQPGQ